MHIFIVEDNDLIRDALRFSLDDLGHRVTIAADGAAALAALEHDLPDVLVTDLRMPGMSGHEVIVAVRARHANLPVVAVSGGGPDAVSMFARAAADGADAALQKPFTPRSLLAAIETACAARRSAA